MPTESESLAAFATALRFEALPQAVVDKITLHTLDLLGVALAAVPTDFGGAVLRAVRALSEGGTATVVGSREPLPPPWAALVNGTLGHGLDYDDTHSTSVVHVSTSVVPAALAVAEACGADGQRTITALAAAMEANIRIGLAAPGAFHDRGFHPTGICGAYAATVAAGVLYGLSAAQLADALGLAGSQASGTFEFLTDGSWSKRLHPGWAAHSGIVAARLAAEGFRGPRATFEGRFGLFPTHVGDGSWDATRVTADLGRRWELLDISLKPYPCCHMTHAFVDCAARARADGIGAAHIEALTCFIHPREMPVVCEPLAAKQDPQTEYDAKFSLPYCVASMLVRGHADIDDFAPGAVRDPAVLAVAQRVTHAPDPDSDYPAHFPGTMRITLRDGRRLDYHEPLNRGCPERPLERGAVEDKFRRNAARVLPEAQVALVIAQVAALPRQRQLAALMESLRA